MNRQNATCAKAKLFFLTAKAQRRKDGIIKKAKIEGVALVISLRLCAFAVPNKIT